MRIKVDSEVCQICGGYADWDTSYGKENFIVCHSCYFKIRECFSSATNQNPDFLIMTAIFGMAYAREVNSKYVNNQ
jgi:hypothetical protein